MGAGTKGELGDVLWTYTVYCSSYGGVTCEYCGRTSLPKQESVC